MSISLIPSTCIFLFKKELKHKEVKIFNLAATSLISALDLELGNVEYVDNIGKDVVLEVKFNDTIISSGKLIPKKSKIDLVLGNGNK